MLGFETTRELIERLEVDTRLKHICRFSLYKKLPSEATFSRAFAEFAKERLAEKVHEMLIKETLGDQLIDHVSRDSTAIEVREKAQVQPEASDTETTFTTALTEEAAPQVYPDSLAVVSIVDADCAGQSQTIKASAQATVTDKPKRRGRPKKGGIRLEPPPGKIELQRAQTLPEILAALPTICNIGTKKNAKGFKKRWKGYKLGW